MAKNEAFGAYYFEVTVPGVGTGRFRSVSGLKLEQEVVSLREGGCNDYEHKLMGGVKYSNVVLKQGLADPKLCSQQVGAKGKPKRHASAITITQKGPKGTQMKWTLQEAWICKWEGPELDASKNEISVETIEIAHHGFTVS